MLVAFIDDEENYHENHNRDGSFEFVEQMDAMEQSEQPKNSRQLADENRSMEYRVPCADRQASRSPGSTGATKALQNRTLESYNMNSSRLSSHISSISIKPR